MSVQARDSLTGVLRSRATSGAARKVLLLTSSLGYGHVRAADAIGAALRTLDPSASIRRLDFWSLMNPGVAAPIKKTYLEIVQRHADLYDRVHRLDDQTWRRVTLTGKEPPPELRDLSSIIVANCAARDRLVGWDGPYKSDLLLYPAICAALPRPGQRRRNTPALGRVALLRSMWLRLQRRMQRQLERLRPDVVVATQMIPAALVSAVKTDQGWSLPSIGVLTDFGVHDFWIQRGTDLYCVPDPAMSTDPGHVLTGARVDVTGVPLMPGFANAPSQAHSRKLLELDPQRPVVLVLGGGLGIGVASVTCRLLDRIPSLQVLVVTGHNAEALETLTRVAGTYGTRLAVRGWIGDMPTCMSAASIIVGKPGGLTVAESLASGRPLLATRSLRGQEGFNVRFLERHRVGRLVSDEDVPAQVEALLQDEGELQAMQMRALQLGRRNGAEKVAHRAIEFADRARAQALSGTYS